MDGTIGEIRMFAGNFPPRGWFFCNGSLQSIANNSAFFAVIGTMYGGDGQQTFGLPNLQGRVPIGVSNGANGQLIDLGEMGGSPSTTLFLSNIPAHNHSIQVNNNITGMNASAAGNFMNSKTESSESVASAGLSSGVTLHPATIGNVGGGQSFDNRQPYLGINYIICAEGIFPSRN